ncbi:dipeptide/oligopeptide/nickel ABC transporter permease/ATP-binding protein [Subtercola sp. YIM 133946]|uniref:dipeptide/oligopeptide/nickel ABC transporter permease/ATP-binding protein n=1 Tax=Subtercola sp. YIM 133946 TaxID=3118909 RepID=UPI002F91E26B
MTEALTADLDSRATRPGTVWRRYLRRPAGVIALAVFVVIALIGVLAPLLSPSDPNFVTLSLTKAPPSAAHWLGGDSSGRDILSRLIWGTRTTLYGALIAVVSGLVVGGPAGVAAGYFGGKTDRIGTWISDALQAIPGMIILLIVAAASGADFTIIMIAIGVFMAPGYFRIARSTTLSVRNEPYIDAAKVAGLTDLRTMSRHIIRAVYPPIIIQTALTAGIAMGMQAGLQFLGIGSAVVPSWGAMMNDGFRNMLTNPLLLLWPAAALGVTIAVLAIIGSTLADLISVRTDRATRRQRTAATRRRTAMAGSGGPASGRTVYDIAGSAARIENLRVSYAKGDTDIEVVHGITLDVAPGEVLGIVGESGSGKSQTVFSLLDLLPNGGNAVADAIWINGLEVTGLSTAARAKLLGTQIGYIPQEPMSNLDPSYSIGFQLVEPLRTVHSMRRREARARAVAVLERVGITDPERVMRSYPHQLSGGMAQRVLIAGAIAGRPSLLVADEPTTALDVTVQAEVLELLRELQAEYGMALLLVTHNFGVVADICDRVAVMSNGHLVEVGDVDQIFEHPADEYTAALIGASLDESESRRELDERHAGHPAADRMAAAPAGASTERPASVVAEHSRGVMSR